ncbi:hypothetical protein [Calidifontibacillus erzurumensis]|nr:hypothetical protein [Calidifontibacillus erzurumensis]
MRNKLRNEDIGIWSKQNGIEWGSALKWEGKKILQKFRTYKYAYAISNKHGLQLECEDFVHPNQKIFLKKITLHNDSRKYQDLTLFFQQDIGIQNGTAFFSMSNRTIFHEDKGRYVLFNGMIDNRGISQYTTWQDNDFYNKNFLNIENGSLLLNPIAAGQVKSAFSIETTMLPYEIKRGYYWAIAANDLHEIQQLNEYMQRDPEKLVKDFIEETFGSKVMIPQIN